MYIFTFVCISFFWTSKYTRNSSNHFLWIARESWEIEVGEKLMKFTFACFFFSKRKIKKTNSTAQLQRKCGCISANIGRTVMSAGVSLSFYRGPITHQRCISQCWGVLSLYFEKETFDDCMGCLMVSSSNSVERRMLLFP